MHTSLPPRSRGEARSGDSTVTGNSPVGSSRMLEEETRRLAWVARIGRPIDQQHTDLIVDVDDLIVTVVAGQVVGLHGRRQHVPAGAVENAGKDDRARLAWPDFGERLRVALLALAIDFQAHRQVAERCCTRIADEDGEVGAFAGAHGRLRRDADQATFAAVRAKSNAPDGRLP